MTWKLSQHASIIKSSSSKFSFEGVEVRGCSYKTGWSKDRKVNRHMKKHSTCVTSLLSKSITKQSLKAFLCQQSPNSRLLIINTENVLVFCYCTAINILSVLSEERFCFTSDYTFKPNYPNQYYVHAECSSGATSLIFFSTFSPRLTVTDRPSDMNQTIINNYITQQTFLYT